MLKRLVMIAVCLLALFAHVQPQDLKITPNNDPRIQKGGWEQGGVMLKKKRDIIWVVNGWSMKCVSIDLHARMIEPNYDNVTCWPDRL